MILTIVGVIYWS